MLLVPLLLRVGLLAGLLIAVHHLTTRLSGRVGTYEQPVKGDSSSEYASQGDTAVEISEDGKLSSILESAEDVAESDVHEPLPSALFNATSAEETVSGARGSDVLVSINGESFRFHYIPDFTTFGDLAAEFCKSQGSTAVFLKRVIMVFDAGPALGLGDMRLRFKDCVLPLERHLRDVFERVMQLHL